MSATSGDRTLSGLAKSSAVVATGTLLSRITGLGRVIALAWALGGGSLADVYNLANTTPNIIFELLVGGVLAATIVPLFVRQMRDGNDRSTSAIFTVTLTVLVGIVLVAIALAPLLARLFTLDTAGQELAAQRHVVTLLMVCFFPQIVFYGLTVLATALLNAANRFLAAAYAPVCNNLVVIGALWVYATRTPDSWTDALSLRDELGLLLLLGLGTTAGVVVMGLVLVPPVRRVGVHLRPVFAWRDEGVRKMARLSGWTFGYVASNQLAQLFVLVLAKTGSPGDVTAYLYAFTFYVLPHSLIAVSIMTTMTPELSRLAAEGDDAGLRRSYTTGLRYLIVLMIPASVLFAGLAHPIVGVLNVGKFGLAQAGVTADTLQLFALSLVPFSVYLYTLRVFYAHHDTRTPFLVNLVENGVNIALALALFPAFGVQGLAMAWGIAYSIGAAVVVAAVRHRFGRWGPEAGVGRAFVRAIPATVLLAIVAIPLAGAIGHAGPSQSLTAAVVAGAAGGVAYLAGLALARSPEMREIVTLFRRRRGATSQDVSP